MNNIIVKTALKTFLAIVIILFVAFGVASLGFPQHMATLCENMGAYSIATGYASLRYTYTDDMGDLSRCLEDSIFSQKDKNIVAFGDKMLADKGAFEEFCAAKSDGVWQSYDYRQYVLGAIASSKLIMEDGDGAIETATYALDGESGFPVPNAAGDLAETIGDLKDRAAADKLYAVVSGRVPSGELEAGYHTAVLKILSSVPA